MKKQDIRTKLGEWGKLTIATLGVTALLFGLSGCSMPWQSSAADEKASSSQQEDASPPGDSDEAVDAEDDSDDFDDLDDFDTDVEDADDFELWTEALAGTAWMAGDTEIEFTDQQVDTFQQEQDEYPVYTMNVYLWDDDKLVSTETGEYTVTMSCIVGNDDGAPVWEVCEDDTYFLLIDGDGFEGGFHIEYDDGLLRLTAVDAEDYGSDILWPGYLTYELMDDEATVYLERYA